MTIKLMDANEANGLEAILIITSDCPARFL